MNEVDHDDMSNAAPMPAAAFQDLVGQYHHRLLSLEADLKDQGKSRSLSARAFTKRVKRLKEVQDQLAALQRACLAEAPGKLQANDIGLPLLDACTPAEKDVCERFLAEREAVVAGFADEAASVYKWLTDAVTGRAGAIRMTLRLSRLRRFLQTAERRAESLEEASVKSAVQIDKVLKARGSATRTGGSTLDALMAVFNQLDGTIARVARLKALVRKEQHKTRAMEAWLHAEEGKIRARTPTLAPPTPLTVARAENAAWMVATEAPAPTYRTVRRRKVAEDFWHDVVHNGARAPTEKEIARAASLIFKARPSRDREGA